MKIYEDYSSTYPDALNHYWNLSKYSDEDPKNALFMGWAYMDNLARHMSTIAKYKKRIYLNNEHPCLLQTSDLNAISLSMDSNNIFNTVYTLCPYTAKWANFIEKSDRFKYIFTPFNKDFIVDIKEDKQFDALYWGGMHGMDHKDIIDTIKNFDYNFLSLDAGSWNLWWGREPNLPPIQEYAQLVTGVNLERRLMWKLLRKTKVNVIANLLYTDEKINNNIRQHDNWEKHEAFDNLDQFIMPQMKTRAFETAVNRCLMVVRKDPWNMQEDFFEPNKEFIYYNDKKELHSILEDVKINWKNYEQIVENAFNKAVSNYSTEHFIEKIKKECL